MKDTNDCFGEFLLINSEKEFKSENYLNHIYKSKLIIFTGLIIHREYSI